MTAHDELLQIHRVIMCIGEVESTTERDPYTLRAVKDMARRLLVLETENARLRGNGK